MQVGNVLRILVATSMIALSSIGFAATAGAGPEETPEPDATATDDTAELTEEQLKALAEKFQEKLLAELEKAGIDTSSLDPNSLIGEKGDDDLAPGTIILEAAKTEYDSAPLSEGGTSKLTGPCLGVAFSFSGSGESLDAAADFNPATPPIDLKTGEQAFTADNPFEVDVSGFVVYAGWAPVAPLDHNWKVVVQGLNLDSGGDDNEGEEQNNAGSVDLGAQLPAPAKVNALFKISGDMTANKDTFKCDGSGYIRTTGGTPVLEVVGILLLAAGGLGALFNARPAKTW